MRSQKPLLRSSERLPVPSTLLRKMLILLKDNNVSAAEVTNVIKTDPTLVGKILKLANSAYIGLPRTISSIKHAVVLLGMKRIESLMIATELLSPCSDSKTFPFSILRFRRHAVTVAFISEAIAKNLQRYVQVDENELFAGALLHDIGKLIAGRINGEMVMEIKKRSIEQAIPMYQAEDESLSHTQLGFAVADAWGFPQNLLACIQGHHEISLFPESRYYVSIVHVSDIMAHVIRCNLYTDEKAPAIDEAALSEIGLPVERLRVITDAILKKQNQIEAMLEAL